MALLYLDVHRSGYRGNPKSGAPFAAVTHRKSGVERQDARSEQIESERDGFPASSCSERGVPPLQFGRKEEDRFPEFEKLVPNCSCICTATWTHGMMEIESQ